MIKKTLFIFICILLMSTAVFADDMQEFTQNESEIQADESKGTQETQENNPKRQGGFQMPERDFQIPEGNFQMPEGDFQMPGGSSQMPESDTNRSSRENMFGQEGFRPGNFSGDIWGGQSTDISNEQNAGFAAFLKEYMTPAISLVLLAFSFVFVIFYKRKNY